MSLVVGMGISGAMMAEALTGERPFGDLHRPARADEGSTAATTALVQFEIDQPLTMLIGHDRPAIAPNRPGGARG